MRRPTRLGHSLRASKNRLESRGTGSIDRCVARWYKSGVAASGRKSGEPDVLAEQAAARYIPEQPELDPRYLVDVLLHAADLHRELGRRLHELSPLLAFIEEHRAEYRTPSVEAILAKYVRDASGSPEEDSPDRAPIPVPEAVVTEADAPQGLSDKAPLRTGAPVAVPTVAMKKTELILTPFDEDLFSRLATGHPGRVVEKARKLLLAADEIDGNPGRYLTGLAQRTGGRPPRASPMPDADELEAVSRLYWEYRNARRNAVSARSV